MRLARQICLFFITFFLIFCGTIFSEQVFASDWTTYLHDTLRQGANTGDMVIIPQNASQLQKVWTYKAGSVVASQPVVVSGIVYVGSWDGYEYALDAKTGTLKWKTYLGVTNDVNCNTPSVGVTSTPTVTNGILYIGGGDAYWYALNPSTGAILWKVYTGDNSITGGHYNWASPLVIGNDAYIGIASLCDNPLVQGQLLKVDLSSHQVVSTYNIVPNGQVGGGIWTSPAYDPGSNTIFVTTGTISGTEQYAQALLGIDPGTMTLKDYWQVPLAQTVADSDWGTTPIVFTVNGITYVAASNKNGYLYVFRVGQLRSGPVWSSLIAKGGDCPQCGDGSISSGDFSQNVLYYGGGISMVNGVQYNGTVRAFNPSIGQVIWAHGAGQSLMSAISMVPGVVFDGAGSVFEALNSSTGKPLYTAQLSSIIYGAPSVAGGMVYMGTTDGTISAFGIVNPTPTQRLGGIDLYKYCNSVGQGNAVLSGNTWTCTPSTDPIPMNSACQYQYTPTAIARQDNTSDPYSWSCYATSPSVTPTPTATPTPTPTATPTPTSVSNQRLGGMNLDGYCKSLGQTDAALSGSTWQCVPSKNAITMTSACQWQYNAGAYAHEDDPTNPYTWSCYQGSVTATPTPTPAPTSTPTRLGGMDLDGYCKSLSQSGVVLSGNTWQCVPSNANINMTSACQWQYVSTAYAIQDRSGDSYSWSCYKN